MRHDGRGVPRLAGAGKARPPDLREVILLSVICHTDVLTPETANRESLEYWRFILGEQLNIGRMALE